MRIAFATDERTGLTDHIKDALAERGHEVVVVGEDVPWPDAGRGVGEAVVGGDADRGVVCCWTGTGVSIAANKVPGVRAALCGDAETARGARKWNDANVLALSLRGTSEALLAEILDGWFEEAEPSRDEDDVANIRHIADLDNN
jgi:ribose 5-phosphate isomerase B